MNVAISAIRNKNAKLNRYELIGLIQSKGHSIYYIGQDSEDDLHPDYQNYNVNFLSIPLGRDNTNPFKEIISVLNAKKVIKENNIEALIVYGIRTFPTVVTAAKIAGVNNVLCIVNGSGRLFLMKGIKGFFVKLMSYPMLLLSFLLANNVLFQNSDDLNMIKSKGLLWRENYGIVNGSGVNLEDFKLSELPEESIFLMIGRLTGDKGVNEYIDAAIQVNAKYPEAKMYLVGPMDNDDLSLNLDKLNKAVANGNIILVGRVEDVRPYISKCRVYVLPSYHEGTPRTVLEAMAMGRPIITTNVPGCKETVINGENGFLIPPKDSKILANKMIWMIENADKVRTMGIKSREICEQKYDVHKINRIILENIGL